MSIPLKTNIIDLTEAYGLISVSGKDAQNFLQGQLTCDIRDITETAPGFGAFCNAKGRIRALFRIFLYQDSYYLQLPRGLLSKILSQLKHYAKFSKVILEDVSDSWQRIGVWGKEEIKEFLLSIKSPFIKLTFPPFNSYFRFELLGPPANPIWTSLSEDVEKRNFEAWKLLDIQAGIPEVWPETTEQFLPHYLNLPKLGAVSFNKGCYCGQEIIARMEYRTTLKRHMFQATLLGSTVVPIAGTPLYLNQETTEKAGTVISASQGSKNTVEMLIEALDISMDNSNKLLHLHKEFNSIVMVLKKA